MKEISLPLFIGGSLLMYLILGIKVYLLDMWLGVPVRMFFYNMFNQYPLPEKERFGFVHRRAGRVKTMWAGILCATGSIAFVFTLEANPIIEVVTYAFDTTAVFFGFMLGPWAYRTIKGKNRILEKLDEGHQKLVDGTIVTDARDKINSARQGTKDFLDDTVEHVSGLRPFGTVDESIPEPVSKPVTPQDAVDPREAIRKFTERK